MKVDTTKIFTNSEVNTAAAISKMHRVYYLLLHQTREELRGMILMNHGKRLSKTHLKKLAQTIDTPYTDEPQPIEYKIDRRHGMVHIEAEISPIDTLAEALRPPNLERINHAVTTATKVSVLISYQSTGTILDIELYDKVIPPNIFLNEITKTNDLDIATQLYLQRYNSAIRSLDKLIGEARQAGVVVNHNEARDLINRYRISGTY